jgi:hypothetical protein
MNLKGKEIGEALLQLHKLDGNIDNLKGKDAAFKTEEQLE